MPSWKRVVTSGSDAQLNSVYVPGPAINQLTASVAITALNTYNSTALNSGTVQRIDSASVTWSIQHNLNEFWPIVYVWQEDPDYVYTPVLTDQVKVVSQNEIQITFPTATRGYANISRAGHIVSGSVPWTNLVGPANVTASLNIYGNVIANQGFTGSLWGTSSWATSSISSSYSDSASMAQSASWAMSSSRAISASYATTSSYVLTASYVNELTQKVGITGSIDISGSSYFNGKLYVNTNGVTFPISTYNPSGSSGKSLYIGSGGDSTVTDSIYTNYGSNNIGIGSSALNSVTFGYSNTAIGNNALPSLTTGSNNIAIGDTSLANLTTGTGNIAIGAVAGNIAGSSNLETNSNSIYIGNDVRGGVTNGQTNEIVIGASAIGKGSNTIVLGNNSTIRTYLVGNVAIGSITVPTSKLHVSGANGGRIAHFYSAASPNAFVISGSGNVGLGVSSPNANLVVSGSTIISGSLVVLGGITGSLFGTSSWAENATSASWAISASRAISSLSSSYSYTASSAISSSYSATSSYANNFHVSYSFTASGLRYPSVDNGEESFIQTDGSGNLTLQYVKTIYEEIYNGETTPIVKGTPLYVSGAIGAAAVVYRADAANQSKMPVVYVSADTIASGEIGRGVAIGLIKGVDTTGYAPGTEIYIAAGGGWTNTRPTGSAIVQVLGYVTKEGSGGQGVVLNPGPANIPNLNSGSVWVGNSLSVPIAVSTSSLSVLSSSYAYTASSAISSSRSVTSLSASYAYTASSAVSASVALTASFLSGSVTSASYAYTASSAISSSWATTASRAITALTSSYSLTASFAPAYLPLTGGTINGDLYINGTASIAYLNVTYESSSVIYSSGSNQFGDATNDVHRFVGTVIMSGSQQITGSLTAPNITGSLQGTSSWSTNSISASYAYTASSAVSASWAISSSRAITSLSASYAFTASSATSSSFASSTISASYAYTASSAISSSFAQSTISASYSFTASSAISSSWTVSSSRAISSISASYAYTASSAESASYSYTASSAISSSWAVSSSRSISSLSASYAFTASISLTASFLSGSVTSASYAFTASSAVSSSWAVSSSRAISSVSASYSYTASSAESSSYAYTASSAISASWSVSSSRSISSISASYAYTASSAVSASWAISSSRSISSISASYSYTASSAVSSSISISSSYSVSSSQAISASWAPMNISGSNNYIALWSGSTNISSSILYQSGSNIGINKTNPTTTLDVNGNTTLSGSLSVSGSVTTYIPPKIISSSYTLTIQDAGRFTEVSSSAAVVITIPADSSVDYPIGAQTMFAAFTTSSVSFTTGSNSVTLRSSGNRLKLLQQYSGATLVKRAANDWYIFGDMSL